MALAETKVVISAEDRTRQAFESASRSISGLTGAATRLNGALAAVGLGVSLGGLAAFSKASIDAADELGKMSQKVGVGVEALSGLKYAAELSDVSLEALGGSLKKLSVNAADTAKGTGEARDAFAALGINVKDAEGNLKGSDKLLAEIADSFAGMEDGAGKTALAVKLFGRSGADLIPLLNAGSAGIKSMREEAERLGIVIDERTAKSAEQFNDNLTRMKASASGLGVELAKRALPGLTQVTDAMTEAAKEGGFLRAAWVGLGGLGTALFTDDLKTPEAKIKDLNEEIAGLEENLTSVSRYAGASFIFGDSSEILAKIDEKKKKVADLTAEVEKANDAAQKGNKNPPPALVDTAAIEAAQSALRKAFSTKPLDDYIDKLRLSSREIDAEYRRLVASLTGTSTKDGTGLDISTELTNARRALASKDAVGLDIAVGRGKDILTNLRDNGGTTDEITYYARQLQAVEQQGIELQRKAAESARDAYKQVAEDVYTQAAPLKFPVDVPFIVEQIKQGIGQAMSDLQINPYARPSVSRPAIAVTLPDTSLATASTKFGGR